MNNTPIPRTSPEVAALNSLLNAMNDPNIQGIEVPKGVDPKASGELELKARLEKLHADEKKAKAAELATKANPLGVDYPPIKNLPREPEPIATQVKLLFFTGRLGTGKDNAAAAAGATVFGFADPLYAMASHYFGVKVTATEGKDLPGIREFLQLAGQWGRNVVTEKYPLTVPRAIFQQWARADGILKHFGFPEVAWESFGLNAEIWLNACIARAEAYREENPSATVAVTNCRFEHEFKRLQACNFQHWHVMCSAKTWAARLAKLNLTPESPAVRDLSESLAGQLDGSVIKQLSAEKQGPKLRVIWSDEAVPSPSPRLHTVETFLKSIGK